MNTKYYHQGISLRQYCEANSINYDTIKRRIKNLKEKNPNLSDEELVSYVLNPDNYHDYKYYHQGISLKQYCEANSINYGMIKWRIKNLKERNPDLSDEELVSYVLNPNNYHDYKYYHQGIPLKQYCEANSINYGTITKSIRNLKERNPDLSDEELVSYALNPDNYYDYNKYYHQGIPLKQYCKANSINYSTIIARISALRIENPDLSDEELVFYALNPDDYRDYNYRDYKYYHQGIPLKQYCEANSINYGTITKRIRNLKERNPDLSDEELVSYALNPDNYHDYKYYYEDTTLSAYCAKYGYAYTTIVRKYMKKKQELPEINDEEIMRLVVEEYRLEKERRDKLNKIRDIFHDLEVNQDRETVGAYCSFLGIDFERVQELKNAGYTTYQAVSMIWYFSDQQDEKNRKMLSKNRLTEIEILANSDLSTPDTYSLICLYKCHIVDTREILWNRYLKINRKMIAEILGRKLSLEQYHDLLNELQVCTLEVIDKTYSNIGGEVINYLKKTIEGTLLNYVRKNISYTKSLDEDVYENKKTIDFVVSKPVATDEPFSEEMINVIGTLPKEEIQFLLLRFQENLSYDELAKRFGVLIEDIQEKEMSILSKIEETLYQNEDSLILKKVKVR